MARMAKISRVLGRVLSHVAILTLALVFLPLKGIAGKSRLECQPDGNRVRCLVNDPSIYPRKIYIFAPKNLSKRIPPEIMIHFHGYLLKDQTYSKHVIELYPWNKYFGQMDSSILVIPESRGNNLDYAQF